HSDWALIIVGEIKPAEQPFVNGLKQQAERAGVLDRVLFTGPRPFEELPSLFACMSIVTALSRNEGFGLTVLEAMSSARAVIASRAGAWPDILTPEENGLLVDIGDVSSTEAALQRLITDGDLRSRLAANARQTVLDRFSVETEAQALLSHYRALAQA
ncbi:glycosyltransferase family 4 protein, partial [Pseudomonadales bacterium]|nr:glycosyltransferase family 4 protein [Pseudomonadales bacterium]